MNQSIALPLLLLWVALNAGCTSADTGEQPLTLPDGSRYSGAMNDGLLSGEGRLEWPNGDVYEGEFLQGLLHGTGTMTLNTGDVYSGEFSRGEFTGVGDYIGSDGTLYHGDFSNYEFTGEGELTTPEGDIYRGDFSSGLLTGMGTFTGADGSQYAGEFVDNVYEGYGVWENDKWRYTGEFAAGYFDGFGERVDVNNNEVLESGQWEYGRFTGESESADERRARQLKVEKALFDQPAVLQKALDALALQNPESIDLYPVIVAGDGTQDVFTLEAKTVQTLLDTEFASQGRSLLMGNHPDTFGAAPLATNLSLPLALQSVSQKLDPQQDILLLYLSSHGSSDHEFYLAAPGHDFLGLAAEDLANTINDLAVKWKVIIISACYSGGFIESLKASEHLVITAARDDRTSFGCGDSDTMTYFGRAYFEQALPTADSFESAYTRARELITQWESEEEFTHSEPQMYAGEAIVEYLPQWWRLRKRQAPGE
jgi:hypothetical protein